MASISDAAEKINTRKSEDSQLVEALSKDLATLSELRFAWEDAPNGLLRPIGNNSTSWCVSTWIKTELYAKQLRVYLQSVAGFYGEDIESAQQMGKLSKNLMKDVIHYGTVLSEELQEINSRFDAAGLIIDFLVHRELKFSDPVKIWTLKELNVGNSPTDTAKLLEMMTQLTLSEKCTAAERALLDGAERVALSIFYRRMSLVERLQHLLQQQQKLLNRQQIWYLSEFKRISDENRIFLPKSVDSDSKNLDGATEKDKDSSDERDSFVVAFHALRKSDEFTVHVRELISIILKPKEESTSSNQSMLETTEYKRLAMRFDMLTHEDALLIRVLEIFYYELENGRIMKLLEENR